MAQYQIECTESTGFYSRFVLEPLERGQGTTVGNALRRVLLSNLEGTAVTVVRIAGITHEFSTIPGVREDVMDLLLNLKALVLKSYSQFPQILRLKVTGPAKVTAGDLHCPADVEVIDPEQYIATLSEGAVLEMELTVERGYGYRSVDRFKDDHHGSIDSLRIDAVFMPVKKVKYEVTELRSADGREQESLALEIWTNGSISPQEALSQAASVLVGLFVPLEEITLVPTRQDLPDEQNGMHQIQIEALELSVRAYNCLKRAQIHTIADLLRYTPEDLLEIKNFGQKSADEVMEALQNRFGLTLPTSKPKS
ncbi:MAG: DNA-directed RNA polymerase subunit alpha [Pseudanabaenaceae cyanobacterium]